MNHHLSQNLCRTRRYAWLLLALLVLNLPLLSLPALAQERAVGMDMLLFPFNNTFELSAGRENVSTLTLYNTGEQPITGIMLSAKAPEGWVIAFEPDQVSYLGFGAPRNVAVTIRPPKSVAGRDHEISVVAQANELHRAQSFWFTVRTPLRLWVVFGVVLVVVAAFVAIFVTQGSQESVDERRLPPAG